VVDRASIGAMHGQGAVVTRQAAAGAERPRALAAILVGGGIAGVLDFTSALVAYYSRGATPFGVMQAIARGIYGSRAHEAGWESAIVGLVCHFVIALTAAALFYAASRRIRFLTERPVVSGLLYGEVVYLVMNFVVIPLSAIGKVTVSLTWQHMVTGPVGHLFLVGLPISLAVHHFAPRDPDLGRPASPPSPR
jgi:hypothetical protein